MDKENVGSNYRQELPQKCVPIRETLPISVLRAEKVVVSDLLKNCLPSPHAAWDKGFCPLPPMPPLRPHASIDTLLSICDKRLKQDPSHLRALCLRATCLLKSGKFVQALADCNRVLKYDSLNEKGRYLRACAQQQMGKLDQAIQDLNLVIKRKPMSEEALLHRACCYNKLGQYEKAIEDYSKALSCTGGCQLSETLFEPLQSAQPRMIQLQNTTQVREDSYCGNDSGLEERSVRKASDQEAERLHAKGVQSRKAGRLQQAIRFYSESLALNPQSAKVLMNRGFALKQLGRVEQAIRDYRQAIEVQPSSSIAHYNLGISLSKAGELKQAVQTLNQAIRIEPKRPEYYHSRAMVHRRMGQFELAIRDSTLCLELDSRHSKALVNRAFCLQKLHKIQQAEQDFEKAYSISPSQLNVVYYFGSFLLEHREPRTKDALKMLNAAIKIDSKYSPAYNARGLLFDKLGNYSAACMDFSKAIGLWQNPVFYHNRACCLRNMGKFQQAISDFKRALELDPQNPQIHGSLASLLRKLQKYGEAIDHFSKEYELSGNFSALNNIGYCLALQGQLKQAIRVFTQSLSIKGDNPSALQYRGTCLEKCGDYRKAEADFTRAINLADKDPNLYFSRGSCYDKLGEVQKAVADYTAAFDLDSHHMAER